MIKLRVKFLNPPKCLVRFSFNEQSNQKIHIQETENHPVIDYLLEGDAKIMH
jgi:hypothetical protein